MYERESDLCTCACGCLITVKPPARFAPGHHRRLPLGEQWDEVPGPLDTPCWVWRGRPEAHGYGVVKREGRAWKAHRWVWSELFGRRLPPKLEHLCRNRLCVRPDHLEPVDHKTNVFRGIGPTAINAAKDGCIHGHPFSGENLIVRANGGRDCRECMRDRSRRYARRVRAERTATRVALRDQADPSGPDPPG